MSGTSYILLTNIMVAALLCGTFIVIAAYDKGCVSARWFAAAYACGIVYVGGEAIIPSLEDPRATYLIASSAFLLALALLNVGLTRRFGAEPDWTAFAALVGLSLVALAITTALPRDSITRMFLYQYPFFAMQVIGAWIVLRGRSERAIDLVLAVFLVISGLHYLIKPLAAVLLGGVGATSQDYLGTTYALFSQSIGTVFVVATALLLLAILVGDILRDVIIRSETDLLSGLLNRRGFEQRLAALVARQSDTGLPLSLVVCDLDHFKQVNDTHGHAAGDRLIRVFADILKAAASGPLVVGRIGGEEFAIALPGCTVGAARLFAESVRSAFGTGAVEGLPDDARFTASFGAAEMEDGEVMTALFLRADAALYAAKHAGRDCVRVWQPPEEPARERLRLV